MNILFVLKTLEIGGVEVVSSVLANKFSDKGHHVYVFAFDKGVGRIVETFDYAIKLIIGKGYCKSCDNISILHQVIKDNHIDIIINQWGLPLVPIKSINRARIGPNSKVISVFHNDPLQNGRLQGVETEIARSNNFAKKGLLKFKKFIFRLITGYAMRYNYQHSDVFEVLSPSFVSHFQNFIWLKNTPKLVVQTNPITIDINGFDYSSASKRKEIIYVGRLDYTQKRVCRVIETWTLLGGNFPDWRLTIVGDGEERKNLEHMVKDWGLNHVSFEGFQAPRPYYERASVLILTSEFEGFPLVLAECMSFGVVPVVYGSYSAVYDIIEDDKDGVIVPKGNEGFNAGVMAERIKSLMANHEKLNDMALNAIEKSKNYSIDKIYEQWMRVLQNINI